MSDQSRTTINEAALQKAASLVDITDAMGAVFLETYFASIADDIRQIMPDGSIIRVTPAMIEAGAQVHRDDDCQSDQEVATKIYFAMERVRRVRRGG